MINYPNPFSTSTRFVFTLTGSEVPDNMMIQIMTITGKVIREITNADRRKNSDIPQNAKYKTQLPSGIEYFITRARTQKAIDESDNYVRNILPIEISARQIGNTSGFQPGNRIAK